MAETSWPFEGAGLGANINEAQWQKMARRWLASGVIPGELVGELAVSANGAARSVSVAAGAAWVDGFSYQNDAALAVPIAAADATNPRIDRIVVRNDRVANEARVRVLQGVPAGAPAAPALTQNDDTFELLLADVTVPAAAGVIVAGNVTDRRAFSRNLTEAAGNAAYVAKAGDTMTGLLTISGSGVDPLLAEKPGTALPSTYPSGLSTMPVSVAAGWPEPTGSVLTVQRGATSGRVTQTFYSRGSAARYVRSSNVGTDTWEPWTRAVDKVLTATTSTSETTTSTTYVDLATVGPSVTVVTSDSALVVLTAALSVSSATTAHRAYMSCAVSGASAIAASDVRSLNVPVLGAFAELTSIRKVSGLTPGTNLFSARYRTDGGTASFARRELSVIPL